MQLASIPSASSIRRVRKISIRAHLLAVWLRIFETFHHTGELLPDGLGGAQGDAQSALGLEADCVGAGRASIEGGGDGRRARGRVRDEQTAQNVENGGVLRGASVLVIESMSPTGDRRLPTQGQTL